jgi:hypothetical protein
VRLLADLRRMPRWEALVLVAAVAAMAGSWATRYWAATRIGSIMVTVGPSDARVLLDNVDFSAVKQLKIPLTMDLKAGPYTVSVTRPGYERSDQNVEVRPGQVTGLNVKLEPSPDTGFELTSDPPGGFVWLDGQPMKYGSGQQARTNFRASRIAPGHHVLQISSPRFVPWVQDIEVSPAEFRKVHAVLLPSGAPAAKIPRYDP